MMILKIFSKYQKLKKLKKFLGFKNLPLSVHFSQIVKRYYVKIYPTTILKQRASRALVQKYLAHLPLTKKIGLKVDIFQRNQKPFMHEITFLFFL